jgi:UDP-N-acetylglucosamine diphosphorylase / glucose-1-phosphate thymidylyltransferase / UDP-N-acetylgalactosamine diphosphorylase / glucosamine-1-phosphate N-acetyltransferase / galactosamine-1-phosphate N-acetyltransferase
MIQAVVLMAGKGTRQRPLSWTKTKALLPLGGKTILEHILETLPDSVGEVFLIIDPQKEEEVSQKIGQVFRGKKIHCIAQRETRGTGDALWQAKPYLRDRFLVLNGDDIFQKEDLEKILKKFPSLLVREVEDPSSLGVILEEGGLVKGLIEKPKEKISPLANAGLYFLDQQVFKTKLQLSPRGELELTQAIDAWAKREPFFFVKTEDLLSCTYPWDLLKANQVLLSKQKGKKKNVRLEKGVQIKGEVVLEPGVIIKSGTYLEGPLWIGADSEIGPQAYLRPATMIGPRSHIGANVEIKNSIIGEETKISHLSYIGDSVIGSGCSLGAGTITANLRFDQKPIRVEVKGEIIETSCRKLGAILGDGVKIGIHSSLMPGVMIDPEVVIPPHSLVKRNIKNPAFYEEKS